MFHQYQLCIKLAFFNLINAYPMAPRISIRIESPEIESMLGEINSKPATAAQTVLELFTSIRQSTVLEIRGLFSKNEITALAFYTKPKKPAWQSMGRPLFYANEIEETEKYKSSISTYGVDPNVLINKIKVMTSAQVAILQLEIFTFWEREQKYHKHVDFLGQNIPAREIIAARNRQKNPDLEPLFKILS